MEEAVVIDVSTTRGRIIAAALRLAATRPWSEVSLAEIARSEGLGLLELKREFEAKSSILKAFIAAVDDEMLRQVALPKPGDGARDALFEVVMCRLDVLQPYKAAVRSILRDAPPDPSLVVASLGSLRWMLAAAGVPTDGAAGAVRLAGFASLYTSVSRIWLDDDDQGHARTMAALDRRLRAGERTLSTIEGILGGLRGIARRFERRPGAPGTGASSPTAASEPPSPSI